MTANAQMMSRIIILQLMIVQAASEIIQVTPKVPEVNQTATISCFAPAPRYWLLPEGGVLCSNILCIPDSYGSYTFRADSIKTEFIFQSLNRTIDERVWTCNNNGSNYSINLDIYTIPRGLDLLQTPDTNADLGMTSVTFQCMTTSCTYPNSSIEWLYQDQPTSTMYVYTRSIPSSTQGPCILPEKIYTSSLSISQNTAWRDNSNKTVTFFCRIGYSDPTKNITSLASRTVSFAVRVTEAFLKKNNQNITSTLIVTSGEQFALTCVTGASRPRSSIDWYIGSQLVSSATDLIFTPSNTDHNQVIYCQAYNIDPNLKVDSNKPSLYVRVRVTEAFLVNNNQNITSTLTVTSGKQVNLTCLTGTSRPAPIIDWYIGSRLIGNETNMIFTPNNADHNEVIFCQAFNIDPNLKVNSSKVMLFVRVYVSSVILENSAGGTIVFTEGYPRTLKCISSPSRPMPIIRWLLGNMPLIYNITNIDKIETNETHVLTSEITLVLLRNSSNQKVYCEGFISEQETPAISIGVNVNVWYAPDVGVNILGYTVVGSTAVLMCIPQGNPQNYTFHQWIQMLGQTEIRRLNGINILSNSNLTLSNISIQDMGKYICTADNSITGLDGQIHRTGYTHVYVQGPPFIGETQSTFIGETNNSATVEIPFYSNSTINAVKFSNQQGSLEHSITSDVSIYTSPSNITMIFYQKKVVVVGHVAVLHFRNLKDTDFDNYTLELSNEQGHVHVLFDVIASAPPSMPKKFFFINIADGFVVFGIEKGFNGGHAQTFIVEYQSLEITEATWTAILKINETNLGSPSTNGTYYIKIPKIKDGKYMFRVYAENKKGTSSTIEDVYVEIKTELPSHVIRDAPVAAVVGGVVGVALLVITIVVVAFLIKRRTLRPKMEAFAGAEMYSADGTHQEIGLTDNPVYDSSESGPVVLEYAAVVKPKKIFVHAEDSSNVYAQVDKTNTKKGKITSKGKPGKTSKATSNERQVKTSRGDVYENTPLPLKSSGENVYENPGQLSTEPNSTESVYENPETSASKGQLVNKDGLLYADLKLDPPTKKAGKPVIHGLDDRTEYAEIAYGKKGEPLPESDDERENGGANKKHATKLKTDE